MTLLSASKLSFSADHGWPELIRRRPSLLRVFALLVLPLSLLPPVMLYFAGTQHPAMFPHDVGAHPWGTVAAVFFLAEMGTLLFMGWLIRAVATTRGLAIDGHDAWLLAAIAPVPMWLSSLGLAVPDLRFVVAVALAGLALSCGIVYHGIEALCRTREDVTAASIAQVVIGAGLIAWVLLLLVASM